MLAMGIDPAVGRSGRSGIVLLEISLTPEMQKFFVHKDAENRPEIGSWDISIKNILKRKVRVPTEDDPIKEAEQLYLDATDLLPRGWHTEGPSLIVGIEDAIWKQNASTLIRQAKLIGSVTTYFRTSNFAVIIVHPMQVKTALMIPRVISKKPGTTTKDLVVHSVRRKLNDPHFLKAEKRLDREAICDAIGIALAAVMLAY